MPKKNKEFTLTSSYQIENLPEFYTIPLRCVNCGEYFINDEPDLYNIPVRQGIHIRKGMKISDMNCPVCGCQTLARWYK